MTHIQINIKKELINLFFIDFRGTNNEDGGPDLCYPYIAYLISDIIIINESKMIYNTTLKNLESVATYINDIKKEIKNNDEKYLIFRVSDY